MRVIKQLRFRRYKPALSTSVLIFNEDLPSLISPAYSFTSRNGATMKPAPLNPLKERVAKHLRNADTFAKERRYHDALIEIDYALALDPKNYYARSFKDRVRQMADKVDDAAFKESRAQEQTSDDKLTRISELLKVAEELTTAKNYKGALVQIARVYAIDPQNYYAQAHSERIEMLMEQEAKGVTQPVVVHQAAAEPQPVRTEEEIKEVQEPKARLEMYRQMLREMWFDGQLSEAEIQELKKVRGLFGLSDEEHAELEKQVHIDSYVEALTIAWKDGSLSKNEREILEVMRKKFSITMEQHLSAEAKLLWARNTAKAKAQIMIVDDDKTFLLALAANLKKHGYDILTSESVEKALEILSLSKPALILSDLMFAPGAMGGLEFYENIRSNPRLKDIPFLLMSGVSDEFVVRAGMRMGIDNFFQKPFNLELLLATIEGKISQN